MRSARRRGRRQPSRGPSSTSLLSERRPVGDPSPNRELHHRIREPQILPDDSIAQRAPRLRLGAPRDIEGEYFSPLFRAKSFSASFDGNGRSRSTRKIRLDEDGFIERRRLGDLADVGSRNGRNDIRDEGGRDVAVEGSAVFQLAAIDRSHSTTRRSSARPAAGTRASRRSVATRPSSSSEPTSSDVYASRRITHSFASNRRPLEHPKPSIRCFSRSIAPGSTCCVVSTTSAGRGSFGWLTRNNTSQR